MLPYPAPMCGPITRTFSTGTPSAMDSISLSACMPRVDFHTVSCSPSHAATAARGSSAEPECDGVVKVSSTITSASSKPSSTLPRVNVIGLPPTRLPPT